MQYSTFAHAALVGLLGFVIPRAASAQSATMAEVTGASSASRHTIHVSVGLRTDAVREDLVVPLGFAGPGGRLGVGYRGVINSSELELRADIGMAALFNRFGHSGITADHSLGVSWVWPVKRWAHSLLSVGTVLVQEGRVTLLSSWDDAHGYWIGAAWLGPYARYQHQWRPGWRLEGGMGLACVGLLGTRPAYRYNKQDSMNHLDYWFVQPYRHANLETIWNLQALRLDLALRRTTDPLGTPGHGWAFGSEFRLLRAAQPAMAVGMSLNLYVAYAWGL